MGEFADMSVAESLEGYWGDDEYEGDDSDWAPYTVWRKRKRIKKTNQEIFKSFASTTPVEDLGW